MTTNIEEIYDANAVASTHTSSSVSMKDLSITVRQGLSTKEYRTSYIFGRTFEKCFTGKDLIDYLLTSNVTSTRTQALQVGQQLMNSNNLFEHVTRDYTTLFDDAKIYYRLISPSERGGPSSTYGHMSWSDYLSSKLQPEFPTTTGSSSDAITTNTTVIEGSASSVSKLSPKDQHVATNVWPLDEYNIGLLNNVHPLNWQDPIGGATSRSKGESNNKNSSNPNHYDMVVIGGGPAGLVTAAGSAGIGGTIRVALIEKHLLGGDCLNVGCIPSKTFIHSANLAHSLRNGNIQHLNDAGITFDTGSVQINFTNIMERVRQVRSQISSHDSAQRYSKELGVDVYIGHARFTSPNSITVNGQTVTFKRAAIATGASPTLINEMVGLIELHQQCTYNRSRTNDSCPMVMTNETIFNLTKAPKKLIVIGSGVIGCELGQAMQRLGISTTILGRSGRILQEKEDDDLAWIVQEQMINDGVECRLNVTKYIKIELTGMIHVENGYPEMKVTVQEDGIDQVTELFCDTLLIAAGRRPNVTGMDLELAKVHFDQHKGLIVNDKLQTSNSRIYGVGDCCATNYKFTHAADFMARAVIRNALFFGKERLSSLLIPHATFTSPEIASVGSSTAELQAKGTEYRIIEKHFKSNDRAITDDNTQGLVRFRISNKTDEIYGATIVANNSAGNMISEITLAIQTKTGLGQLASVIHPYPTTAETIRQCGDLYNKTRLTTTVKSLLRTIVQIQR